MEMSERTPDRKLKQKVSQNGGTYSCYTAAPGGSCEALVHAAQPCVVSLATSARLHSALVGVVDLRRKFGDWSQIGGEVVRSRLWSVFEAHHPCEGLEDVCQGSRITFE